MVDPSPERSRHSGDGDPVNYSDRELRRQRRRQRAAIRRYQKTMTQFAVVHIIAGVMAVCFQLVQFTNHSILSQSQPGLWCGTFSVLTGAVCLALAGHLGLYSTVVLLSFSLVSLFLSLTLSSLSWLGTEAAGYCQYEWAQCQHNQSQPTLASDSVFQVSTWQKWETDFSVQIFGHDMYNTLASGSNSTNCNDIKNGLCGYSISLARIMHSLLVLMGVIQSTISFVLSAVVCSRPSGTGRDPDSFSSPFVISRPSLSHSSPTRPITAWEFPAPVKSPLPSDDPPDPPPPYEECQPTDTIQCSSL